MVQRPNQPLGSGGRDTGRTGPGPRFHSDFVVAAVVLVFCAAVVYLTMTFEEVPPTLAQGMQPADFPRLVVGVIVLLTVIMVLQARGKEDKRREPVPAIVYFTILAMIGFLIISQWIDLFLAIIAFCATLPLLWGERRYALVAAFAVILPVAIFVLFSTILEVRFPRGVLTNFIY